MNSLLDRRFLFVTGKGGVGKTTVTAALALKLAAQGKRVLCAACNAKERFSTLFGVAPVGAEVVPLATNIWGVNMEPSVAMAEYGMMILKSRTLYNAVFENRYVRSFFRATPGLYEWAMLGKAWWHTTEQNPDGSHRFDVVLLDAPATGHGLDMLRVPKVIVDIVPPGILRRDADQAWEMFRDSKRSGVVVVTLPEDMPVSETLELLGSLESELRLPVERIVINGMLPPLFSQNERNELIKPNQLEPTDEGHAALAAGARRSHREIVQAQSLARLTDVKIPKIYLPHLFEGAETMEALRDIARRL